MGLKITIGIVLAAALFAGLANAQGTHCTTTCSYNPITKQQVCQTHCF
jgi:hypothetical protein